MKKKYSEPEFILLEIHIGPDILNISDPEPVIEEGGGGAEPDPFGGDLNF